MDMEAKVKSFLSRYINLDDLENDTNFFQLGMVNSLFSMQLVMFLESNIGIELNNDDIKMDNFKSVNAIVKLIKDKKAV